MKLLSMVALLPLALLSACTSGPGFAETEARIPELEPGLGRIFVYRPSNVAGALTPAVRLNEEIVGQAAPKGFLFVDRPPGSYEVRTSTLLEHSLRLELGEGQVRYVRLRSTVGLAAGHVIPSLADAETAQRELGSLRYVGSEQLLAP